MMSVKIDLQDCKKEDFLCVPGCGDAGWDHIVNFCRKQEDYDLFKTAIQSSQCFQHCPPMLRKCCLSAHHQNKMGGGDWEKIIMKEVRLGMGK